MLAVVAEEVRARAQETGSNTLSKIAEDLERQVPLLELAWGLSNLPQHGPLSPKSDSESESEGSASRKRGSPSPGEEDEGEPALKRARGDGSPRVGSWTPNGDETPAIHSPLPCQMKGNFTPGGTYTPTKPEYSCFATETDVLPPAGEPEYYPGSPKRSPPHSPSYSPPIPSYSPDSKDYVPTSPSYSPTAPVYSSTSSSYVPRTDQYVPDSPGYNPGCGHGSPVHSPSPYSPPEGVFSFPETPVYLPGEDGAEKAEPNADGLETATVEVVKG